MVASVFQPAPLLEVPGCADFKFVCFSHFHLSRNLSLNAGIYIIRCSLIDVGWLKGKFEIAAKILNVSLGTAQMIGFSCTMTEQERGVFIAGASNIGWLVFIPIDWTEMGFFVERFRYTRIIN